MKLSKDDRTALPADEPSQRKEISMENFSLDIDIGNAAMSEGEHVAGALRAVADKLEAGHHDGPIMDENGNRVGGYAFDQLADKRPAETGDERPAAGATLATPANMRLFEQRNPDRDLPDGGHVEGRRCFALDLLTGETFSASAGDYWTLADDKPLTGTAGDPMVLAVSETRYLDALTGAPL